LTRLYFCAIIPEDIVQGRQSSARLTLLQIESRELNLGFPDDVHRARSGEDPQRVGTMLARGIELPQLRSGLADRQIREADTLLVIERDAELACLLGRSYCTRVVAHLEEYLTSQVVRDRKAHPGALTQPPVDHFLVER